MTITIDEKLFAHINNDPFLIGSVGLEGNHFTKTIGYLNQYIKELPPGFRLPEEVLRLQSACDEFLRITQTLISLNDVDQAKEGVDVLAQSIVGKVKSLREGEYLLVPGGWNCLSGGHAMVISLPTSLRSGACLGL